MEEYTKNEDIYKDFTNRLCLCDCDICAKRSPHPVFNCLHVCQNAPELEEKEKLKLGLYKRCKCNCPKCVNSKYLITLVLSEHIVEECYQDCTLYNHNKI
jgi:hypothetical protein